MPTLLSNLVIDRVDLVEEGANSAAFIELYKRKERGEEMTLEQILKSIPEEQAKVIQATLDEQQEAIEKAAKDTEANVQELANLQEQITKANEDLDKYKSELETVKKSAVCKCGGVSKEGICKECGLPVEEKKFDETETLKSMPKEAQEFFKTVIAQKEAAEEELKKARAAKEHDEAVAKAKTLKSLPIEQDKLVSLIKSGSDELLEVFSAIDKAIGDTVLGEVGKGTSSVAGSTDAWSKIDARAKEIAKEKNISEAKAVHEVIKEQPELYKEYLEGGAN